jgi:hypothetical protein
MSNERIKELAISDSGFVFDPFSGGTFTLNRPISAAPLVKCPACKKPVRKIISGFSTPHKLKPLSISDAKKSGFQVYKRLGKGEYERQ